MSLSVKYFHEMPGIATANIMWSGKWPMKNGKFPVGHPAAPQGGFCDAPDMQCGATGQMPAFRDRGYWASCFPEGDGITLRCLNGQTAAKVASDITDVFGWAVKVERS